MIGKSLRHSLALGITLAFGASALTWGAVAAQCGFSPNDPQDCGPGERERKQRQPVLPTATYTPTPTPSPTPTYTPSPTPTLTTAAAVVLPPPEEKPDDGGNAGGWLPLAGILLALGIGLGYVFRRGTAPKQPNDSSSHETGHWLGLHRTFYGGSTGGEEGSTFEGDTVKDTGRSAGPTFGGADVPVDSRPDRLVLDGSPNEPGYGDGTGLDIDATLELVPPFEIHKDDVTAEFNTGQIPTLSGTDLHDPPAGPDVPEVGTRYTMFLKNGTPMRPTVNLKLTESSDLSTPHKTPARKASSSDESDADPSDAEDAE